MLTVTDSAKSHLKGLIDEHGMPETHAIRLVAGQQGLGMAPDEPRDGDATYEHDGRTVLVVEQQIADQLDGRTMDVEDTDKGPSVTIS